jgi:hypothetical protein
MTLQLKANGDAIREALRRHGRRELYHWTPAAGLPSVLAQGLLCRRELEARHIAYDAHGYGRAGKEEDFAGFVCASFVPSWGMMRREIGPLAVIEMPSIIATADRSFYCPDNTARNDYEFDEVSTWTELEHFEAMFDNPNEWKLVNLQAEVWIPDGIPVDFFRTVYFRSDEDLQEALRACEPVAATLPRDVNFRVKVTHFPDPGYEKPDELDWEDIPF